MNKKYGMMAATCGIITLGLSMHSYLHALTPIQNGSLNVSATSDTNVLKISDASHYINHNMLFSCRVRWDGETTVGGATYGVSPTEHDFRKINEYGDILIKTETQAEGSNAVKLITTAKNTTNKGATISLKNQIKADSNSLDAIYRYQSQGYTLGIVGKNHVLSVQNVEYPFNTVGFYEEEKRLESPIFAVIGDSTTNYLESNGIKNYWMYAGASYDDIYLAANSTVTREILISTSQFPVFQGNPNMNTNLSREDAILRGYEYSLGDEKTGKLIYSVDGGVQKEVNIAPTGNKFQLDIDLTGENLAVGNHSIDAFLENSYGQKSMILHQDFHITELKAPTLVMREGHTNQNSFFIEDNVNEVAKIIKYQYRINEGKWIDIPKDDINTPITMQEGSTTVSIKAIGNNDESPVVTKTALVDTTAPTVAITEKDKQVDIQVEDKWDPVYDVKYVWNTTGVYNKEKDTLISYDNTPTIGKKPITYQGEEKGTLYLIVIATDMAGNVTTEIKEYTPVVAPEIEAKDQFIKENPTFKIMDSKNDKDKVYGYEVKVNDADWVLLTKGSPHHEFIYPNGTSTIHVRTVDVIGRVSEEVSKSIDVANSLPNTGLHF